jgi:NADH dehydrogenase
VTKHNIVIVGGGFGGTKAALVLAKSHKFDVTLVHDHPDFRYYPTLYETATGGKKSISSIPITEIFMKLPINLVQEKLTKIDRINHKIETDKGTEIKYDGLILALGVKTNFFHIQGLEEYAYGIKTIDDAEKLKSHLHDQIISDNKPDLNYVVVGGGPTGIELAGVLPAYINKIIKNHGLPESKVHVDLVEAAPRLLPRSPKVLSKKVTKHLRDMGVKVMVKSAVQAESIEALTVNNKPIRSHTVIWTAGMANHPFYADHEFNLSDKGRVLVDQYLQAEPGIYVLGDNADTQYSGMAQTAIYDGDYVAQNLIRLANRQMVHPYIPKKPIYVFAAGAKWAAVQWGPFEFYGRIGSWLKRLSDFIGFNDFEPWKIAFERSIEEFQSEESCPICSSKANIMSVNYES